MRGRSRQMRNRLLAAAVAGAGHLAVVLAVLLGHPASRFVEFAPEPTILPVALVEPPPPPPPPPPKAAAAPAGPKTPVPAEPRPRRTARPTPPPPPEIPPLLVPPDPTPQVSEAALALAATAGNGSGAGGGGAGGDGSGTGHDSCDMVGRLQRALRGDPRIHAAIAQAPGGAGRAVLVWNGDWVRSGEEDGKGLAGVRQAIAVEVAFAPKACRSEPVRGLVLISLSDGPGGARLVLGASHWRWSDLLHAAR